MLHIYRQNLKKYGGKCNMSSMTIYYPISFETEEVLKEVKKYGSVFTSGENPDTREVYTTLSRSEIAELEEFFVKNEIPYDLLEYSKGMEAPKMKKVRPEQGFSKEIQCVFYQNDADEIEDGVITVSRLLSIIENSSKDELEKNLLEEIKKATFKFDEIEDIFEM
jgi:hypothetical protein